MKVFYFVVFALCVALSQSQDGGESSDKATGSRTPLDISNFVQQQRKRIVENRLSRMEMRRQSVRQRLEHLRSQVGHVRNVTDAALRTKRQAANPIQSSTGSPMLGGFNVNFLRANRDWMPFGNIGQVEQSVSSSLDNVRNLTKNVLPVRRVARLLNIPSSVNQTDSMAKATGQDGFFHRTFGFYG
ncbi:hypothetical protein HDE_03876 [Halotydeus destructor]|nr:hypothetical protein HDE_03876 [Halotydeus destructor]